MDFRCCAYSYLMEDSACCDYEIETDDLASSIALACPMVKHSDLDFLIELVYHANGSIRGQLAITQEDFNRLNALYDQLLQEVGPIQNFVIPTGCPGACVLHTLRVKAKKVVRIAYKVQKEGIEVSNLLLDFLNLLSNVFFMMALLENKKENIEEKPFVSKSYDS